METRQLAKENTFNTSFSSNGDNRPPIQVIMFVMVSKIAMIMMIFNTIFFSNGDRPPIQVTLFIAEP